MPSGWGSGAGVIACAEVVTAKAKPATAINLSIVFLLFSPSCSRIVEGSPEHVPLLCWTLAERTGPWNKAPFIDGRCDNLLAGWRLAMSGLDKMLEWLPHTSREWIELIIMTVLLWLLMMAVFELELGSSVSW
jgi:hypothetical protein